MLLKDSLWYFHNSRLWNIIPINLGSSGKSMSLYCRCPCALLVVTAESRGGTHPWNNSSKLSGLGTLLLFLHFDSFLKAPRWGCSACCQALIVLLAKAHACMWAKYPCVNANAGIIKRNTLSLLCFTHFTRDSGQSDQKW